MMVDSMPQMSPKYADVKAEAEQAGDKEALHQALRKLSRAEVLTTAIQAGGCFSEYEKKRMTREDLLEGVCAVRLA